MATTKTNAERLQEVQREHGLKGSNPALYVGTYRKYNNGSLFGCWLDLTTFDDFEDFMATCRYLHADESDPELMYQDFMDFPKTYYHEGWMDEDTFDSIREYAELDDEEAEAYCVFCDHTDDPTIEKFKERYAGKYDSLKEYMEHNDDDACSFIGIDYDVLDKIRSYIDYEQVAIEADIEGYLEENGFVFRAA